jgi:hypothetical protein
MIPSDADLQAAIDRAVAMGMSGLTGTDSGILMGAMSTAWDMTERAMGTNILATGTDCDIMDRPSGWVDHGERYAMVALTKTHLLAVDTVTLTHDQFECDCADEDATACAHVHNERFSHLRIEDCLGPASCACSRAGRPTQLEICYTAGRWGTVAAIPRPFILALGLVATWWTEVLLSGGAAASGAVVDSWRSMDYSESRGFVVKNVFGTDPRLVAAWNIIRTYRVVRAPVARGYYHTQHRGN